MKTKDKLDAIFSRYIRARDCPDGFGRCISCGAIITPKTCDAGHFIPRVHRATRWNEKNVNAQCLGCNRELGGNLAAYRIGLIKKYGIGAVEELERLKFSTVKLSENDLKERIKEIKIN